MNKILFFLFALSSVFVFGQTKPDSVVQIVSDTAVIIQHSAVGHIWRPKKDKLRSAKSAVLLQSNVEIGSDAVLNEMFLGLLRGEYLTREVRQRSSDAIAEQARIGQAFSADLSYIMRDSLFGKSQYASMLGIGYRNMIGSRFSKEVYDLTFFGNKPFEDKTVDLAPSVFEQQKYQKFGWGIFNTRSGSSIMLSIVKGQKYQEIDLEKAEVYTAPDGRLINADMQGSFVISDTSDNSFSAFNGIGFAFDFEHRIAIDLGARIGVTFKIADLGIGFWNQNTLSVTQDTALAYDGITIENIFDLDNIIIGEEAIYDTIGLDFERGGITRLLPFHAQLIVHRPINRKTSIFAELGYRYLRAYTPRLALRGLRRLTKNTSAGVEVAYGGFSKIRAGAFVSSFIGKNISLSLSVPNLPGPFSDESRGAEGIFKLGYYFY